MRGRWVVAPLVLVVGISLSACDPAAWFSSGGETGKSSEPAAKTPSPPARAPATDEDKAPPKLERLEADLGSSKIGFAVEKATSEHIAVFEDFAAQAQLSEAKPTQLTITIQMASLRSDREALTKHLRSAEFFDVDKFPTSTFAATAFHPDPGDDRTHMVTGKLHLHGVEREITFPADIRVSKDKALGRAELTIDPRDYGIVHPALREELVDPNVLLQIELNFPRG